MTVNQAAKVRKDNMLLLAVYHKTIHIASKRLGSVSKQHPI